MALTTSRVISDKFNLCVMGRVPEAGTPRDHPAASPLIFKRRSYRLCVQHEPPVQQLAPGAQQLASARSMSPACGVDCALPPAAYTAPASPSTSPKARILMRFMCL